VDVGGGEVGSFVGWCRLGVWVCNSGIKWFSRFSLGFVNRSL